MRLGINFGEVFMWNWGDMYKNTFFINPYFVYVFNENAAVSANIDYFTTEVKSTTATYYSSLVLLGGTAGVIFNLKFTENYGLSFSIGAGLARTVITVPGMNINGRRKDHVSISHDPYISTSLSFNYNINNLQFGVGLSSKKLYYYSYKEKKYENNDMDIIGVFLGVSIKT